MEVKEPRSDIPRENGNRGKGRDGQEAFCQLGHRDRLENRDVVLLFFLSAKPKVSTRLHPLPAVERAKLGLLHDRRQGPDPALLVVPNGIVDGCDEVLDAELPAREFSLFH